MLILVVWPALSSAGVTRRAPFVGVARFLDSLAVEFDDADKPDHRLAFQRANLEVLAGVTDAGKISVFENEGHGLGDAAVAADDLARCDVLRPVEILQLPLGIAAIQIRDFYGDRMRAARGKLSSTPKRMAVRVLRAV